jgi:hypothetical protein
MFWFGINRRTLYACYSSRTTPGAVLFAITNRLALPGASMTSFRTFLTVFHMRVFFAFVAAQRANVSTQGTEFPDNLKCMFIGPGHKACRHPAHVRAVTVKLYTGCKIGIVFMQAGSSAMLTRIGAYITCVDAGFEFFVTHFIVLFRCLKLMHLHAVTKAIWDLCKKCFPG